MRRQPAEITPFAGKLPANGARDIVFIINPSIWHKPMYPTGVLCLSNYLESGGFPNTILDSKVSRKRVSLERRISLILEEIRVLKPKIVCFSSTHKEFSEVTTLNREIRALYPEIITIVGGAQPTYRSSDFLDNGFDFVCIGEGERTLHQFVREIMFGTRRWEQIPGLEFRKNGQIHRNERRALLKPKELDSSVFSAYDKIDRRYFDFTVGVIRGLPLRCALLLTSRGCPFSCSFCGCNSIFGRSLRLRPLESIELELTHLKSSYNIEGIWIVDDTFTVNKEHSVRIAELLKRYDIIWGCQSRVDTIDASTMSFFKRCGCAQIDFGVESGSQRILDDIIEKRTNTHQIIEAFRLAKDNGIRTLANFMVGLPTETREDLQKTKRLAKLIGASVYVFSIATPLPGTKLYDMVGEDISPHLYPLLNWNGSPLTDKLNKSKIPNISREKNRLKNLFLLRSMLNALIPSKGMAKIILKGDVWKRLGAIFRFFAADRRGAQ